jgi:hypothetical protein
MHCQQITAADNIKMKLTKARAVLILTVLSDKVFSFMLI